jgi:hypothetical protein
MNSTASIPEPPEIGARYLRGGGSGWRDYELESTDQQREGCEESTHTRAGDDCSHSWPFVSCRPPLSPVAGAATAAKYTS